MLRFAEFYEFDDLEEIFGEGYIPELYEMELDDCGSLCGHNHSEEVLNEIDRRLLLSNTDPERIRKARQELRTRPPIVKDVDDSKYGKDAEVLEYNFKAFPSSEFKRHQGYVIYNGAGEGSGDQIYELFCDCKDFFYRLYKPLVSKGLATFNLPPMYNKKLVKTHSRANTVVTNPTNKIYLCKHLWALVSEYITSKPKVAPIKIKPLNTDVKPKIVPKTNITTKPTTNKSKPTVTKKPFTVDRSKKQDLLNKKKQELELKRQQDLEKKKELPKMNIGKKDQEKSKEVDKEIEVVPDEEEEIDNKNKK